MLCNLPQVGCRELGNPCKLAMANERRRANSTVMRNTEVAAWSDLSGKYRRPLLSFFLKKTGNYADAEDLVHEVFLKLLDVTGDLPDDEAAYVFTVAQNTFRDRYRRDSVRARYLVHAGHCDAEQMDLLTPERLLSSKIEIDRTMAALGEMSPQSREIFVLFRFEQISQREIAAKLGISVSAVEKHIARVLIRLRRLRS